MTQRTKDYDVDMAWPASRMASPDQCLQELLKTPTHVFHGAHEPWPRIISSFDLFFRKYACPKQPPGGIETQLFEEFYRQCFRHLQPGARRHIELARLRWHTYRTTGTMFVARHYGLPTRAVDWTPDALIALFFACRRRPMKDGVVWCMERRQFEDCIAKQWRSAYNKTGHIEADFEKDFSTGQEKDILLSLYFPAWMPRPIAQQAFVTVSGAFNVDHAEKIYELAVKDLRRVIIPAELKRPIIDRLDLMGINGYTLEIGDSTIEIIATDIASSLATEQRRDQEQ